MLKNGIRNIENYLSLVKFSHTIFAMPFALWGFFLAIQMSPAVFQWRILILVVLCMVFARNTAMGFNRWADRRIDALNPRTAMREIPSGIIRDTSALWFVIINALLFIITTAFINSLTFWLSPLALLIITAYTLTKRFTAICHFILGLGLSLAPLGAWLAVSGTFHLLPVLYALLVLFWVSGFDIIYSLQDDKFDKKNHLNSLPVLLGRKKALFVSCILHFITVLLVISTGIIAHFGLYKRVLVY